MKSFFSRRSPYIVAPFVGLCLAMGAELALLAPADQRWNVWALLALASAVAVAASGVLVAKAGGSFLKALRLSAPVIFLTVGAFLFLLQIETAAGRLGLAVLTSFLAAVYLENLRLSAACSEKGCPSVLTHLSAVVDAVAFFFLLAFVFGLANFYYVSLPAAALAVGAAAALLAHETLWRSGFRPGDHGTLVVVAGLIGLEAYVALSLLPTLYLVDAAVAVVLLAAAMRIVKQVLSGAGEFRYFRKELAASLALAAILLATARWI